jgi:uncharacterized protein
MMRTLEDIKNYVQYALSNHRASHAWDHTQRVYRLCLHIGEKEGADLEMLKIAALLHDIGRNHEDEHKGNLCHAQKGAEIARDLLENYPLPRDKRENIIHSIRSHRFRSDCPPETIEAKVLFDADKLDAIGAIGIGRAFLFAGEIGARLHNPDRDPEETAPYSEDDTGFREYKVKLSKIKDRMLTAEGLRLALVRHEFMESFFDRFLEEHDGLK